MAMAMSMSMPMSMAMTMAAAMSRRVGWAWRMVPMDYIWGPHTIPWARTWAPLGPLVPSRRAGRHQEESGEAQVGPRAAQGSQEGSKERKPANLAAKGLGAEPLGCGVVR